MLRKLVAIVLLATFSLVACENGGYDTRTGDAQTGTSPDQDTGITGTSPDPDRGTADTGPGMDQGMDSDPEMGAPRERDMDTRTGGIRTRPGGEVDPDTGIDYGAGSNPGTGSIPESSSQDDAGMGTGTGTTDDATANP